MSFSSFSFANWRIRLPAGDASGVRARKVRPFCKKKNNLRPRMRYSRFLLLSILGDVHGWSTCRRAFFLQHAMSRFISLPPFAFANVPHMMMMMIPSSSLAGRRNRVTLGITQGAPSHKGGGRRGMSYKSSSASPRQCQVGTSSSSPLSFPVAMATDRHRR